MSIDENELRLAANVFSSTLDAILITDPEGTIIKVNRAFEQITDYSLAEVSGQHVQTLFSARQNTDYYLHIVQAIREDGVWQEEITERRKDGHETPFWVSISSQFGETGQAERYIAILFDNSEQKLAQERIKHLAYYDMLTGLPNRLLFMIDYLMLCVRPSGISICWPCCTST